ncbi:MAG: molybdopterin dinucleotide binding domain-containing protein, partial [Desulfuromonadales bacterium]
VRALVCLETDPLRDYPDPSKAESALAGLEFLAVLDCVPSPTANRADVFLPTTVPAEGAGVFVNNEGRMLPFETVLAPGLPIRVTGDGNHPPRVFEKETPGTLPRPAWSVLGDLAGRPSSLAMVRRDIEEADSRFAGCAGLTPGSEGRRVASGGGPFPPLKLPVEPSAKGEFRLLPTETLFGSELLSSLSPPLDSICPAPFVLLHVEDAKAAGIEEDDRVTLVAPRGRATASARLSAGMARGVAVLPRLRGTPLETFVPGGDPIPCRLEKEGG